VTTTEAESALVRWAVEAEAAAGIARQLAPTSFVPDSLRVRDPGTGQIDLDATTSQIAAALLTGQELKFPPMASLRAINVIPPGSGSPALTALALRALLLSQGHDIWVVESTDTRAVVRARRFGQGEPMESVWTIDRAAKMKLRQFNNPDGNWRRQPANMLLARSTAEIARWIAADAILALPYVVEELDEFGQPDLGDSPDGDPGHATPPLAVRGRSPRTARRSPATPRRARPAAALPPATSKPTRGRRDTSDAPDAAGPDASAESPDDSGQLTGSQRSALWAGMRRIGVEGRDPSLRVISGWIGRDISSSNELTQREASLALDQITAAETRLEAERAQDEQAAPDEPPAED